MLKLNLCVAKKSSLWFNVDIVRIIKSLTLLHVSPSFIFESPVCFEMFVDIFRLLASICSSKYPCIIKEVGCNIDSISGLTFSSHRLAPS